ncbi:MAG: glycyl-radical enzyme activating protein [Kiritimatiellae bacterium]|nr:glycyl-radical enzyme activating protein [Kiritimatiellia bacterium]
MTIPVADIRRLTLHDGPGTRTTVFVKGCPLRCRWCHNPECLSSSPTLLFHDHLCVGCGLCAAACPERAHVLSRDGSHSIDRARCRVCGACAEACWLGALEICGRDYDPEELLRLLIRDKAFYDATGGGVTVSGGEPLLYADAVGNLFALLKQHGVRTALDTCGDVHFDAFEAVLPATDLVLYDIKGMDSERHRANTGRGNECIHDNLRRLGARGVPIEVRMPVVPGCNDAEGEFEAAAEFLAQIPSITAVRLLPYRSLARAKYRAAGLPDTMPDVPAPNAAFLEERAVLLRRRLHVPVLFENVAKNAHS